MKLKLFVIIAAIFGFVTFSFSSEEFSEDTKDKIIYCGLNQYLPTLKNYRQQFGELYVRENDQLLNKKIMESEFGDDTYEGVGFDAFEKQIVDHKGFCQKEIRLNSRIKVDKYNKEEGFFPFAGFTKDTYFPMDGSFYRGKLFFDNANADVNKIFLAGKEAKEFIAEADKYSREFTVRNIFKVTGVEADIRNRSYIETKVTASLVKMEFLDKRGYVVHTIEFTSTKEALNGSEIKSITFLRNTISLDKKKFSKLDSNLFDILKLTYQSESTDLEKLLELSAHSSVLYEGNPFQKKRLVQDAMAEVMQLDKFIRNGEMTVNYSFMIAVDYNIDKEEYTFDYFGVPKGYIYERVSGAKLLGEEGPQMFAVKFPKDALIWKISPEEAERQISSSEKIYVVYTVSLKPKGVADIELTQNEKEGYLKNDLRGTSIFFSGADMYTDAANTKPSFIELEVVGGTRELVAKRYNGDKVLLKETLIK